MMKAVIMAGGKGTRIRSVASDIPKPMIPVLGKPVLQYQIECLKENGITEIFLVTGYLGEVIRDYFGDGSRFGVTLRYFHEETPMGTAGALYYLKEELDGDFLLLMGDLMLSVDFRRFAEAHRESGAWVSLFVHPNSHPYDSDLIVTDEVGKLEMFTEEKCGEQVPQDPVPRKSIRPVTGVISKKQERPADFYYHNQVNAGLYFLSLKAAERIPEPVGKVDLDKDIIHPLIEEGKVFAYRSTEYVKDMGTPERYDEVTGAVRTGIAASRNLSRKQKCIFMDRDGTINVERGFLNYAEGMDLLPGAAKAVKRINESEYLAVLITNQPVIARGECSFEELDRIMRRFETLLGREGAYIDAVYYCPHHQDKGFEGEVPELKFRCRCRKGKSGMIEDAVRDLNIDPLQSWMIGDKTSDIKCGMGAGTKTILLETGAAGTDGRFEKPSDLVCRDLSAAVDVILGK